MKNIKCYVSNLFISFDQLVNTIIGGSPDETLSARAWREQNSSLKWHRIRLVIDGLFCFQDNHCYQAYLSEVENKQLPTHYQLGDDNVK